MNGALILAMLRQRAASPVRLALLAFLFIMPLLFAAAAPTVGLSVLGDNYGMILVLAAGLIGQDLSSGVLQLLFARPVTRSSYVLSRWLAVCLASVGLCIAQALLCSLVLSLRGAPPDLRTLLLVIGDNAFLTLGLVAVVTLFSTLLGGFGDLAILLVLTVSGKIMEVISQASNSPILGRVGTEIENFVLPKISLAQILGTTDIQWFMITSYASTLSLCLALAIVVMNRRELSYASSS
jgi:ABC-type transport system involved in multi-copper enzyme maturation permease subunit